MQIGLLPGAKDTGDALASAFRSSEIIMITASGTVSLSVVTVQSIMIVLLVVALIPKPFFIYDIGSNAATSLGPVHPTVVLW